MSEGAPHWQLEWGHGLPPVCLVPATEVTESLSSLNVVCMEFLRNRSLLM